MTSHRQLSIYEKNQLLQHGLQEADLLAMGEMPVEYLTGVVAFRDLAIQVKREVLIPRVETEELVELVCASVVTLSKPLNYLEIGIGSGAISLAVFDFCRRQISLQIEHFCLTDLSPTALRVAEENWTRLFGEVPKFAQFLRSDLLSELAPHRYDRIVANLPYLPTATIASLDASVRDFEPLLALDGGPTGFELIARMLEQVLAGNFLAEGGQIFLEVDESHDLQFITKHFSMIAQNFLIKAKQDQFARQRFLVLQKR